MIEEILKQDHAQVLFGITIFLIGLGMFYYSYKESRKLEKDDYIRTSFHIRKYTGAIIFLLVGIVMIIRVGFKLLQ